MTIKRRGALLALLSGGSALGVIGAVLLREPTTKEPSPRGPRPRLRPFRAGIGSLTDQEKRGLWQLATATGALWSLTELSEDDLRGFLDLKTQRAPSYLAEYRNALEVFDVAARGRSPSEAIETMLRDANDQGAAAHARQFVLAEFVALHLASGGFRRFGLTRYRGFIGDGYRVSGVQPGKPR